MVKGISKRVVVVRPPESGASFEQAIFFLKEDGRAQKDVLREACAVAEGYLRAAPRRMRGRFYSRRQLALSFLGGALASGLLCAALVLVF